MGPLLLPLPVLAVVLAALDAVLVRWTHPWRASGVELFFQGYFLWLLFGLVALLPARWTLGFLDARSRPWPARGYDARPWVVLAGWMTLPIAAEATLSDHASLVGFAGLARAQPWLELGGTLLLGATALALLGRLLGALPGVRTAVIGVALAFGAGLILPARAATAARTRVDGRPNLLLLVWDTCRADKLEPYGQARPLTPGLARLAEESIVYENVLSASTFTFTSHLSLLSGVSPETHGARMLDMHVDPARASTIAAELEAAGYRTGAFVGTDVLAARTGLGAGFEEYDDAVDPEVCETFAWRFVHALQTIAAELVPALRCNGRPHWIQDFQRPGSEVLARAGAWIRRDDPRPWFCFVNLYDAHWPYLPEGEGRELVRPYDGPVDGFLFRSDRWQPGYRLGSADRAHVNDLYEGEIYDLDAAVARFLATLELARGDTAVVVTADHGEGLGEENTWNHDDVREPQVRVPLLVRLPEPAPAAQRVRAPVSGIDVAPTLLGLAGLGKPAAMEGRDLLHELPDEARERWVDDRDHLEPADYRCALYEGAFKLVRFGVGRAARYELYDLAADPAGFTDVQAQHVELCARLVERMRARTGDGGGPATTAESGDSAAGLQALGYAGD
jgi:arylsulfatase A-like enzyme